MGNVTSSSPSQYLLAIGDAGLRGIKRDGRRVFPLGDATLHASTSNALTSFSEAH